MVAVEIRPPRARTKIGPLASQCRIQTLRKGGGGLGLGLGGAFHSSQKFRKFRLVHQTERTVSVWSDRNIRDQFRRWFTVTGLACSRRSDSGERCEVKGTRKNKSEGRGEAPLSPVPLYFSSVSLLRTALHYLNAWNRL